MDKLEYQIRASEGDDLGEVYSALVSALNSLDWVEVEKEGEKAVGFAPEPEDSLAETITLSYKNVNYKARLGLMKDASEGSEPRILLTCELLDRISVSLIRDVGANLGIRVFSSRLNSYLPKDPYLLDAPPGVLKPEVKKIINGQGFEPLFYFSDSLLFYASSKEDGTIHLLNNFLLEFFLDYGGDKDQAEEFNYQVAPNLKMFVPMYDFGLVPADFYRYYGKPTQIINHSGFDIYHIDRKVFVKPYILELNYEKQSFYTLAGEGSSLIFCDKIREGETLNDTLRRVLKEELEIADDYIGASVHHKLEFDRDRNGRLTPRLLVNVFVERVRDRERVEERARRTWMSEKETAQRYS